MKHRPLPPKGVPPRRGAPGGVRGSAAPPKRTRRRGRANRRTFRKRDFSSGDGFVTSTWGPAAWHLLHTISFNYPVSPTPEDQRNYRHFILSLRHVLPCGKCRKNLAVNLKQLPLRVADMRDRDSFSRYVYALHNKVNKMLGKPCELSYCDVRERYEHFRSRCTAAEAAKVLGDASAPAPDHKGHKGCTEPLHGKKSKCIIHIVPDEADAGPSIQVDTQCLKHRGAPLPPP